MLLGLNKFPVARRSSNIISHKPHYAQHKLIAFVQTYYTDKIELSETLSNRVRPPNNSAQFLTADGGSIEGAKLG